MLVSKGYEENPNENSSAAIDDSTMSRAWVLSDWDSEEVEESDWEDHSNSTGQNSGGLDQLFHC